jgi:hypothetical protein
MSGIIVLLGVLALGLVPTSITIVAATRYARAVGSPVSRRLLWAEWASVVLAVISRLGGFYLSWKNALAVGRSMGLTGEALPNAYATASAIFNGLSLILGVAMGLMIAISLMAILRKAADDHLQLTGMRDPAAVGEPA